MITAENLQLNLSDNLENQGTLGGRNIVDIQANNITNSSLIADSIQIDANELDVVSLQETSKYDSRQENISGQA